MIRRYATPLAFKQALEQRIKSSSTTGADFARRRQLLVFDRFLARIVSVVGDAAMLKGGLVLEMRLARARTTKDIDLYMMGSADKVLDRLQAAGRLDLGDYMLFEVQPDLDRPEIQKDWTQYDGYRFRAECRLAGRRRRELRRRRREAACRSRLTGRLAMPWGGVNAGRTCRMDVAGPRLDSTAAGRDRLSYERSASLERAPKLPTSPTTPAPKGPHLKSPGRQPRVARKVNLKPCRGGRSTSTLAELDGSPGCL